jgi:predicted NAD/FAD-dependent oxidoreductase
MPHFPTTAPIPARTPRARSASTPALGSPQPVQPPIPLRRSASASGATPLGPRPALPRSPARVGPSAAEPKLSTIGVRAAASVSGRGPLPKDARICIVGAGPAGLTLAARLKENGYDQVQVLEKNTRLGGRCKTTANGSDMGAVAFVPWYYDPVTQFTDGLGIERGWVPKISHYSAKDGKPVSYMSMMERLRAGSQAARYLYHELFSWEGVGGPGIEKVSPELADSWTDFVEKNGYQDLAKGMAVPTVGFGYRSDVPAVYNARYVPPKAIIGSNLRGTGLGYWKGGTQQIWERLAEREDLAIETGAKITRIDRSGGDVKVYLADGRGGERRLDFDRLVLACNPADMLDTLDATPAERAIYGQIKTCDYRTFECEIDGLHEGSTAYGAFVDNLSEAGLDRPMVFFKRDPDRNTFVFYVSASPGASNEAIAANIRADVERIGGKFRGVISADKWNYFPHVDSQAIRGGFYEQLTALQGRNSTCGTGAAYTFDVIPHVMRHAEDVADKLMKNGLPGTGQHTITAPVRLKQAA